MPIAKIKPVKVDVQTVAKRDGSGTIAVYRIQLAEPLLGQTILTCWEKNFVDALKLNEEIEVEYTVKQSGRYTNLTVVTQKGSGGIGKSEDSSKIYQRIDDAENTIKTELDAVEKLLQNRLDNIEIKIDKLLDAKNIKLEEAVAKIEEEKESTV